MPKQAIYLTYRHHRKTSLNPLQKTNIYYTCNVTQLSKEVLYDAQMPQ